MSKEVVLLYDTDGRTGETLARSLGKTVHSWHPKFPKREEPEVVVFPDTQGVQMKHGCTFEEFKDMLPVYLEMEDIELEDVISLNYRGDKLAVELMDACA